MTGTIRLGLPVCASHPARPDRLRTVQPIPPHEARRALPPTPRPVTAIGRRRPSWRQLIVGLFVLAILLGALGAGMVYANAFGMGDRFDRLVAKVERLIVGPPPADRPTRATVSITAPPATPSPTPDVTLAPGASPTPTPTPLVREPVDVQILADPEAVFAHEIRKDWCAPAGV